MWYTQFINGGKSVKSKHAKTLRLMATISVRMKKIPNYHDAVRAEGQKVNGPLQWHIKSQSLLQTYQH